MLVLSTALGRDEQRFLDRWWRCRGDLRWVADLSNTKKLRRPGCARKLLQQIPEEHSGSPQAQGVEIRMWFIN